MTRSTRIAVLIAVCAFVSAGPVSAAPTGSSSTTAEVCATPCADLAVSKEATNEIVGTGERFTYYLTVENDGPDNAAGVTLTDRLPDRVTYISTQAEGMDCTEAQRVVTCTAAELAVDAVAEVEVVVEAPQKVGTVVNEATVTSGTGEFDPSNNTTSLETQVGTGADLMLITYAEAAAPSEAVHFYVLVLNDGPQSAQGVVVTNTLPAGVSLLSTTTDQGSCASPSGRELTCSLGTVAAFALVELEIVVSGIADGVLTNTASVAAAAPSDPDLENNRDVEGAVIGTPAVADLGIYKDAVSEVAGAGERFSYFLSVENEGPAKATAVTLTDELPNGVTYVSADGLPCGEDKRVVTCTAAELDPGDSIEVELVVEAPAEVGTLVNEATVVSATEDFDASNNTSALETRVGTGADLELAASGEHAGVGEPVHFAVSVWNEGPQSAHGVVVEDQLPAGVELLSATPTAGTCQPPSQRRFTCSIGTLAPFEDVEIELVFSGSVVGLLTNLASVTSAAPGDSELGNNRDSHTVVIGDPQLADVAVYKDGPAVGVVGTDLVYALTVQNVGPEIASGVRVTDRLPSTAAFVAATIDGGAPCGFESGTVTCDLGDLGVDEAVDITLTVRPERNGRVTNTAEVVALAGPADPEPESNTSTAETLVSTPPVALDDAYAVDEDGTMNVAAPGVLENDSAPGSAGLTAMLVEGVRHGDLTLRPNGSFTYSPKPNFSGKDSFGYRTDAGSMTSELATVTITVNAVNDPPAAVNDAYQADEDATLTVNAAEGVLKNDTDVEGSSLRTTLLSAPANGTVTLGADGSFTYVPRPDFHGGDSFTYKANDGELDSSHATVTITVAKGPPPSLKPRYRLSVARKGTGKGTVKSAPGIDCGADCAEEYDAGAVVTLIASAATGSRFVAWAGACGGSSGTCSVSMDAVKAVTATFAKIVVNRKSPKVVKKTICFRKRTIKVPQSQVAKYKKRGAKLGPCKKPRKKR